MTEKEMREHVESVIVYLDNGQEIALDAHEIKSFTNEGRLEVVAITRDNKTRMWSGFPFVVIWAEGFEPGTSEEEDNDRR